MVRSLNKISRKELNDIRDRTIKESTLNDFDKKYRITVHLGTCGIASGADIIKASVEDKINRLSIKNIIFTTSGCVGFCALEPMLTIDSFDKESVTYYSLDEAKVEKIFEHHIGKGEIAADLESITKKSKLNDFYKFQESRVLRNRGRINPFKIDDYIANYGYQGLLKAIELNDPDEIIKIVSESGLRGRGGAGFPTGKKWELCRRATSVSDIKYVICNGDEGDPGAFMDRNLLESDPHSVLEVLIAH